MTVSGVVLAAGQSSRLGRPKQLLPLAGKPLIWWTVTHALAARLDEVVVVVGVAAEEVRSAVAQLPVRVVLNERFADGQSSSLRVGMSAIALDADAVLFLLGDQPEVPPDVNDALILEHRRTGSSIVQPVYGGTPGNPVLFDRRMFSELLTLEGDQGARTFLRRGPEWVLRVAVGDGPPPADIDTEADYEALLRRWATTPFGKR